MTPHLPAIPHNLRNAAILLAAVVSAGTAAYMLIEGWSFNDAHYMTVTTVMTIGFGEVRPLDTSGRIVTMLLAISGIGAIFYALVGFFQFALEGELGTLLGVWYSKFGYRRINSEWLALETITWAPACLAFSHKFSQALLVLP